MQGASLSTKARKTECQKRDEEEPSRHKMLFPFSISDFRAFVLKGKLISLECAMLVRKCFAHGYIRPTNLGCTRQRYRH